MNNNEGRLIDIFMDESREHLDGIEDGLIRIEEEGCLAHPELIAKIFRAIHTIKGSSGFFGLKNIQELSHTMESVLDQLRSGILQPDHNVISMLLDGADTLQLMIASIEDSNSVSISHLVDELKKIILSKDSVGSTYESRRGKCFWEPEEQYCSRIFAIQLTLDLKRIHEIQNQGHGTFVYVVEIDSLDDRIAVSRSEEELFREIDLFAKIAYASWAPSADVTKEKRLAVVCVSPLVQSVLAEFLDIPGERIQGVINGHVEKDECSGRFRLKRQKYSSGSGCMVSGNNTGVFSETDVPDDVPVSGTVLDMSSSGPVEMLPVNPGAEEKSGDLKMRHETQGASLRVAIGTLDRLMTLAGEMVLTRNELLQNLATGNFSRLQSVSQKVDSITSELQEAIMSTRMLSVGVVFGKFRRLVRDYAMQLGKQIVLDIKGEDVELDKTIVEAIGDPLTHIVRNSVDHGIEKPDVRVRHGKKAYGTLRIIALHEAGHVLIEISDDGKGIDPGIIRSKARLLGFADDTALAAMSDDDVVKLIFKPGFSTAESVTELSGRGVGMDVVQNNLKRVGGSIDIDSIVGAGTVIRIKLPLTLAIIPALLLSVEDDRYAIPQSNIEELVRVPASDVKNKITSVGNAVVLRLRGELLPLVLLNDVLGVRKTCIDTSTGLIYDDRRKSVADRRSLPAPPAGEKIYKRRTGDRRTSPDSAVNIVVVSAGDFRYGIIADTLLDSAEIVVKPLGSHLCDCREYAGATILGDGHVALILDVVGMRRLLEVHSSSIQKETDVKRGSEAVVRDSQSFLMIENADREFFAVPVGLVGRIDKIDAAAVSSTGGKQVMHYRGATLRLISIEDAVKVKARKQARNSYVIIMEAAGREIGILASGIVDTVDICASQVDCSTHVQPGVLGTAYVRDAFILILDLFGMVKVCAPEFLRNEPDVNRKQKKGTVLIVEDSVFFRNQISSFIEDAGYATVCRGNGAEGLAYLKNAHEKVDIVLTDVEMPEMDGLELTRAIRGDAKLKHLPVIAITSVSGEAAERRGREAGVNEYLIKFERDAVLNACKNFIKLEIAH